MAAPRTTHLWIARHGQTVSNSEGRFCGHSETALTDLGRRQAASLATRLSGTNLTAAYASDFARALETATAVLAGRDVAVTIDSALREIHYGGWEMQRERDIRRREPVQYGLMRDEDPAWQPPGGETLEQVQVRTAAALDRIARTHRGQHVLVISHGTAIACMLSGVLAMPATHILRIETANCGLSHVTHRAGRFGLELLNETSFLAEPGGRTP
jgi:alpha-ribazole phosphatase/probable phosphoglycerate mutase